MRGWEILSCDLQRVFEAHLDFCQCLQASINHDIALRNPHTTFLAHLSAAAVPHAVFLDRKSPPCLVLRPRLKEQSGSGYTVKAVTPHHGPSERFTANLADLDQSTLNTVTGQGGNFLSPHYMDQWKAWYEGSTFTLPFTTQAMDATAAHRLVLEPAR